jgi:hypothetical protein
MRKVTLEEVTAYQVLYEQGLDIYAIGARFNRHGASVARALRRAGVPMRAGGRRKEDNAPRFWSKIAKQENGCWLWQGKVNQVNGYGSFLFHPEPGVPAVEWGAHRCSYILAKGPIPEGLIVRHTCDAV